MFGGRVAEDGDGRAAHTIKQVTVWRGGGNVGRAAMITTDSGGNGVGHAATDHHQ